MTSKVILLSSAQRDFKALTENIRGRIADALRSLADFPEMRSGIKKMRPPFEGYRKRVGDYRILFDFNAESRVIFVHRIRDRKDAYR